MRHKLWRTNELLLYSAMFKQAWSSLKTLCADPKYLGARTGMMAVLHTWGQQLQYHPHIHALVPAGGLSFDGKSWCKPKHKKFLVLVRALSRLFRGRLVAAIRAAYRSGELQLLPQQQQLRLVLDQAMRQEWVVYAKAPFAGPHKLLDYLGRYVKRVAISNDRLLSCDKGRVRFTYRDYTDADRKKVLQLTVQAFIHRFLQHVLPPRFCKLRYYGILAIRDRQKRLELCHRLLQSTYQQAQKMEWRALLLQLSGQDPLQCTDCGEGQFVIVDYFSARRYQRGPPLLQSVAASQHQSL
ncbi:MAG: transposase [Bacteroidota bacterium]